MDAASLTSRRYDVGTLEEAIELCYERGWTDGLPVVPPTEERVLHFLEVAGKAPADVIGVVPTRGRVVTAEKVAINAVMAGCRPEYMPVVVAAVEAMCEEPFNPHGSMASTGGAAVLMVVNGPVRQKLGFNSQGNLFGPGPAFRANATVGRAVRLVLLNVWGNVPGVLDRSTFGHPGKYAYCVAEDEEHSPWEPLHVERGFKAEESTVTCVAAMAPWQVSNRRGDTPESVLGSIADTMKGGSPGAGEIWAVVGGEHRIPIQEAGWSKERCRQHIAAKAVRPWREWAEAGKAEDPPPGRENDPLPVLRPDGRIVLLAAGGHAGAWSVVIPLWANGANIRSVTKRIDTRRIT